MFKIKHYIAKIYGRTLSVVNPKFCRKVWTLNIPAVYIGPRYVDILP